MRFFTIKRGDGVAVDTGTYQVELHKKNRQGKKYFIAFLFKIFTRKASHVEAVLLFKLIEGK